MCPCQVQWKGIPAGGAGLSLMSTPPVSLGKSSSAYWYEERRDVWPKCSDLDLLTLNSVEAK